ncbi:MAG: hypothetical protein ACI8V0_000661 [Pseudohongiellaceae bacterium]|jgi:hypothetical protein
MEEKMNRLFLGISLLVTVLLSQQAVADNRHGRQGYNDSRFGGGHFRSYNRDFDRRGNRNYSRALANPYHYGRAGDRRSDFVRVSHRNRFNNGFNNNNFNNGFYSNSYRDQWGRNRNRSNGSFIGLLVLGSVLNRQSYPSRSIETVTYRSAPVRERNVVYINSTARTSVPATPKRRLLRDLQGDCYEIEISPYGDELRSQVDSTICDF